jgi:hypothetical protein
MSPLGKNSSGLNKGRFETKSDPQQDGVCRSRITSPSLFVDKEKKGWLQRFDDDMTLVLASAFLWAQNDVLGAFGGIIGIGVQSVFGTKSRASRTGRNAFTAIGAALVQ